MSIRQPRPKQIRLPFEVPRPKKGAGPAARVCGICRKQDSRYTCPRCNVPYCSLACFRGQEHAQCSEPFYRSTVMDQIAADPEAEAEEKRQMMAMLKRFEEAAADGEDTLAALEAEDDEGDDGLASALDGVDLDAIDSNELFHLLPQEHRTAFLAALQNPDSSEAKALLEAAVEQGGDGVEETPDDAPHLPSAMPWWEAEMLDDNAGSLFASPPRSVEAAVVDSINPPDGVGVKLVYNVVAICVAYIHTLLSLRLPSLASEYLEAQKLPAKEVKEDFTALLPFLDAKSTVRYESVTSAWGAVWEAVGREQSGRADQAALLRILEMVSKMLHPPITLDPPRAILVLDDVYALFASPKPGAAVPRKIAFYLASMKQLGRGDWLHVEAELKRETLKLEEEMGEEEPTAVTGPASIQLL